MTLHTWLLYLIAVLVLTAAPGPSSLLCMTKSVVSGWRVGVLTAFGSLTAITLILTLSFTGLGMVIASSDLIFTIVKWLGACYLIYLGIRSFFSAKTTYHLDLQDEGKDTQPVASSLARHFAMTHFKQHFFSGFMVGISNPKAILFFTALFPQFIDSTADMLPQYFLFASTFIVLELSWLFFYTYMGSKSSAWLMKSGRAKLFNRLTGGVFVGAGALLLITQKN